MPKRDYREYRRKRLEKLGFLPFEADYYSQFAMKKPGMRRVVRFRARELDNARTAGIPRNLINNYIRASYRAKGYVDNKGELNPAAYNSVLFEELQKPSKERKSLFITPERFDLYRHLTQDIKFTPQEARQVAESIPPEEFDDRVAMYKTLRRAYYSHEESLYIISAQTPPDKQGNTKLQALDLKNEAWQRAMRERISWIKQQIKIGKARGLTETQALKNAKREIENWYRKDKTRTPFDEIEDISPKGKKKPDVDFKAAVAKRRILKQRKEKSPWKAWR